MKKVNELRKKVSSLQKERNKLLENVAKDRRKAKNELLKNLNPIIEAYMQEKKIRLVIDKKNIILDYFSNQANEAEERRYYEYLLIYDILIEY